LADPKELAEHTMLVDLGRNDIGKIGKFGSVRVRRYREVLRFSHVMHIGSMVRGEILEGKTALDAVNAVLPAGTLSGAPKIRACEIINELEGARRGVYGGAIGYLSFAGKIPVLGVCLGHQAICEVFGATVGYAGTLMHGKASEIRLRTGTALFAVLPEVMQGARCHSLAADAASMPEALLVTAVTAEGEVMAVQHRIFPVYGVRFHPESILTPEGEKIMENFLKNQGSVR
jgi:anthranilate synthase component 1